ncbi:uncharacterized protein ARMOST_02704 [Armillaria ostoyae]|uniref:Uncharacterized protein n=1 Tax=Armillaria ostoyae TaxID=47428 RepID=A0A284QSG3_ARMOS|nr:uncharacterized protein ARMOST_02704 [Armillaria ostoyae]
MKQRPHPRVSAESIRPPVATSLSAIDPSHSTTPLAPGCCHDPILPISGIQFDDPIIPTLVRRHLKGEANALDETIIEHLRKIHSRRPILHLDEKLLCRPRMSCQLCAKATYHVRNEWDDYRQRIGATGVEMVGGKRMVDARPTPLQMPYDLEHINQHGSRFLFD